MDYCKGKLYSTCIWIGKEKKKKKREKEKAKEKKEENPKSYLKLFLFHEEHSWHFLHPSIAFGARLLI